MTDVQVLVSGPIYDGRAQEAYEEFVPAMLDEVARQGYADVHLLLNASLRHPTPYYETQIVWDRAGSTRVIHDRDVIYGPWLEGVGTRNKTTRFKGYASFRRAAQQLQGQAPELAEHVLQQYLPRMGGR